MKVLAKDCLVIARVEAGYTIKELSTKSGVPAATISRAENSKSLSVKSAKKLCETLNKNFSELFQVSTG